MSIYKRDFDETKCIDFLINIMKSGKKWAISLKKINSGLLNNKKYLKAIKKINKKEKNHCDCARVLLIDSVYIKDESYYPKDFLEKYNIITIAEKMSIFNEDIEIYVNDSDEQYCTDSDDSDEQNFDRKIQMKNSCINFSLYKSVVQIYLRKKQEKIWWIYLKNNKKNTRIFFRLGTLKFPLKYKKNFFRKNIRVL